MGQHRAMRQGLKEAGFVEGENVTFEYRWGEDRTERVPSSPPIWCAGGLP